MKSTSGSDSMISAYEPRAWPAIKSSWSTNTSQSPSALAAASAVLVAMPSFGRWSTRMRSSSNWKRRQMGCTCGAVERGRRRQAVPDEEGLGRRQRPFDWCGGRRLLLPQLGGQCLQLLDAQVGIAVLGGQLGVLPFQFVDLVDRRLPAVGHVVFE